MTISVRDWFTKQEIATSVGRDKKDEVISLRNSLANHFKGLEQNLISTIKMFHTSPNIFGTSRGCHFGTQWPVELAHVVPSWVSVDSHETRTIEGVLTGSNIADTDFPLSPWHAYYDWNFHIKPDKQYNYLLNPKTGPNIECEWDTAFFPSWAWPQEGQRIWICGRWIYDCQHPNADGDAPGTGHSTEIHPPKAVATFRTEAVQFPSNLGPTRANNAIIYIGARDGYWDHYLKDQNYSFDIYLPPRPYQEAICVWRVQHKTAALGINPQITPYPGKETKALRVVIPLKETPQDIQEYGCIISAGWTDPKKTATQEVHNVRVTIEDIPTLTGDVFTAHAYLGINGRWKVLTPAVITEFPIFSVNLALHPTDRIYITCCGFFPGLMHNHMGHGSGYSWQTISDPSLTVEQREDIEDSIFWQLSDTFNQTNDPIGYISKIHEAQYYLSGSQNLSAKPDANHNDPDLVDEYELRYKIEAI
jgi:hypothetical protein